MRGGGSLAFASVAELQDLLKRRELSAVELATYFHGRLERHGPEYNAVVLLSPERALRAARAADRRRGRGDDGPLLGIPYGAKDIFSTRGLPTRVGTAAHFPAGPDRDATAIRRLNRSGAGLLAKLALLELIGYVSLRPWNSPQGAARSPWDLERWAGGSSGGSGAAVAAGLVPLALGSETAGSVGSPAAWCGITGYRPTYGLVGRGGMAPLSPSLDKAGLLAHTARDCADALGVLAGWDRSDPASRRWGFDAHAVDALFAEGFGSVRVGVSESDIEVVAPAATRAALRAGLDALRGCGVAMVHAALPDTIDYRRTLDAIMLAEGAASFASLIDSGEVEQVSDPATRSAIRMPTVSGADYEAACRAKSTLVDDLRTTYKACDVLVTYNFAHPWPLPRIDEEFGEVPIQGGNSAMVWAGNLAGLPAVFLPVGTGDDGLPVSIQIVGPQRSDALVLALGCALQSATDWHRAIPPFAPRA